MLRACTLFFVPILLSAQVSQKWIDSTYNSLSLDQKIGQLFMVMAYPNGDIDAQTKTADAIKQHVGGLVFSKGTSKQQYIDTKRYQSQSEIPLLIGVDAEWGMAMRLEDVLPYPYQMTLGALPNDELVYALGKRMGIRKRAMGIHVSFSPVADVNTTPRNPIIGIRSFGDNPHEVAQKSIALATGLQDAGLIAVAKHFPGHGASVRDSHKTLPRIDRSKEALDSIDIFPFHALIKMNVKGVMVGHLDIPAIDSRKNKPVSTSKAVVSNILQDSLGFSGLVFTDALNMAGITKTTEQPALACFLAGADVLLIPASLSRAVDEMKQAYLQGIITEERLRTSVVKILKAKSEMGLFQNQVSKKMLAVKDSYEDRYLKQQIARQSITLVKNDSKTFPLTAKTSLTYVSLGDAKDNAFLNALRSYAAVVQLSAKEALQVKKGPVVVAIHADTSTPWTRQYMAKADREFLKKIADGTEVHLVLFSNAYSLHKFTDITKFSSILLAHEQQPVFAKVAAQMLFGVLDPVGKLPVSNRSIN